MKTLAPSLRKGGRPGIYPGERENVKDSTFFSHGGIVFADLKSLSVSRRTFRLQGRRAKGGRLWSRPHASKQRREKIEKRASFFLSLFNVRFMRRRGGLTRGAHLVKKRVGGRQKRLTTA